MWVAFAIVILIVVVYEWWDKNQRNIQQFFSNVEAIFIKASGRVVVDHVLEWHGIKLVERQIYIAGTPEEVISDQNRVYGERLKLKHELHYEPDVNVYWKYV